MASKKNKRPRTKVKQRVSVQRGWGFNTIFLTIVFVLVFVISAFAVVIGLTIKLSINDLSRASVIDTLDKISGFREARYQEQWSKLMDVNNVLKPSERIVYYIVTKKTGVNEKGLPNYQLVDTSLKIKDRGKNNNVLMKNMNNFFNIFALLFS